MEKNYFFCYSKHLANLLRYNNGIRFITSATHTKTAKQLWLFEQTEELSNALIEINGK